MKLAPLLWNCTRRIEPRPEFGWIVSSELFEDSPCFVTYISRFFVPTFSYIQVTEIVQRCGHVRQIGLRVRFRQLLAESASASV